MATIRIFMFKRFRIVIDRKQITSTDWRSKRALTLLKYLLTYRGCKVHKEALFELLWPDERAEVANKRLHTAVSAVRRMLRPEGSGSQPSPFVQQSDGSYWFNTDADHWIDVDDFERLAETGKSLVKSHPQRALEKYKQALKLYEGEFLPEALYEDWSTQTREHLREIFLDVSLRTAQLLLDEKNDPAGAIRTARAALAVDPYREELHQALLTSLIDAGRYTEATNHYRTLTRMLHDEFGLDPSPETQVLMQQLRSAAPTAYHWCRCGSRASLRETD